MLYDAVMAAQTPLAAALERVGDRWSLLLAALPPRTAGAPLTRPWRKFRSIPHGRSQIGCASSDPRSDPLCSPTLHIAAVSSAARGLTAPVSGPPTRIRYAVPSLIYTADSCSDRAILADERRPSTLISTLMPSCPSPCMPQIT